MFLLCDGSMEETPAVVALDDQTKGRQDINNTILEDITEEVHEEPHIARKSHNIHEVESKFYVIGTLINYRSSSNSSV